MVGVGFKIIMRARIGEVKFVNFHDFSAEHVFNS